MSEEYSDQIWWSWEQDGEEAARKAAAVARELINRHAANQELHTTTCIAFYDGSARRDALGNWRTHDGASQYNVIQSTVDTFTSHVIRNRVRLMFLTEKGKRTERQKAQGMTQACESAFAEAGMYDEEGTQVCRDGCRGGVGVVKVTPDYENSRALIERCLREELFVDERDARLGKPRQLVHRQRVDKAVLMARFPEHSEEIACAQGASYASGNILDIATSSTVAEQVEVYELWHLPSSRVDATDKANWGIASGKGRKPKPKHDGRHMLVLGGADDDRYQPVVLKDEPWPLARFPFAFFRVKPHAIGFDGRGFVGTLMNLQLRINRKQRRLEGIENLHGTLKLYINRAANINPNRVRNNDWSSIIEGDGPAQNAIHHISPPSLPGDYLSVMQDIEQAYRMVGLSELTVHAERPKSMQSGAAVRTLLDTESIRHTDIFRAWEDFHKQLGRVVIDVFRLLAWTDPNFSVMWGSSDDLREIKWRECDLEDMRWKLGIWPTNLLPSTPSAKLEKALELYREGAISREQLHLLLDYPDIQAISGGVTSALRNIERRLEHAEKGDVPPEKYMPHGLMNLPLAYTVALERLNDLEAEEAEPEVIDRIQQFLEDVQAEMKAAAPPPGAAGPPPGPGAPGPAPPPTVPGAPPLTTGGKLPTKAGSEQVAAPPEAA